MAGALKDKSRGDIDLESRSTLTRLSMHDERIEALFLAQLRSTTRVITLLSSTNLHAAAVTTMDEGAGQAENLYMKDLYSFCMALRRSSA